MSGFSRWLDRHSHKHSFLPKTSKEDAVASRTIYQALSSRKRELRVLSVEPGVDGEELRASLIVTTVPAATHSGIKSRSWLSRKRIEYEAISYCWGDPSEREIVRLDGVCISAPASALHALRCFRLPDKQRLLWIDALCINQQDIDERSSQVAMMGDIYANATQTLIYLDTLVDSDMVQQTFHLLERIHDRFLGQDGLEWVREFADSNGYEGLRTRAGEVKLQDGENLGLLNVLFEHPWFHRLWVWQEALLAPNCRFHMGSCCTTWEVVMACAVWCGHTGYGVASHDEPPVPEDCLPSYFSRLSMSLPSILFLDNVVNQRFGRPGHTLGYLLSTTSHCETSDPRDRLYALLGLSTSPGADIHPLIRPDYHRSTRECMTDATRYAIADSSTLHVLNDIRLGAPTDEYDDPNTPPWPSWVPVWCYDGSLLLMSELHTGPYSADNNSHVDQSLAFNDSEKDILKLKGHIVDSVTDVIQLDEQMFTSIESLQQLLQHVRLAANQPSLSLSELALILSVGKFITTRVTLDDSRIKSFDLMVQSVEKGTSAPYQVQYDVTYILQRFLYQCRGKVLFITGGNCLGVGLASIQTGDIMTVLYGGPWPFALRRRGDDYRLISSCYVRGIMDGEAVTQRQAGREEPAIFRIR